VSYVAPPQPNRRNRRHAPVVPGCRVRRSIPAVLAVCVVSQIGCVWSWGERTTVPNEIARCRELTEQGTLAMRQGEVAAAETRFRSAVLANPADIDARRLFAETLWARGERVVAIAQMEAAGRLAPHDAALTVRAGEMLLAAGEIPRAAARADQAIAQNPQYGPAWALRGHANWAAGRSQAAVADLQRALVYVPSDERVLLSLARLYLEEGEPRRALTTLHQLADVAPPGTESQQMLLLEGRAYLALRRPADAAESLAAAGGRGTPSAEIYYLLATAESQLGRTDAAIRAAHHALAANASHRESLQLLAELGGSPAAPLRR
jgi:tetratricopeptide (TPR) repeat protein